MIKARIDRLRASVNSNIEKLVQCIPINDAQLVHLTDRYLADNMEYCNAKSMLALPNRGSNGRIRPISVPDLSYALSLITQECVALVKDKFGDAIESVEQPVNIRIYDGVCEGATQSWHSDIWGGEPADIAVIVIPLWGAIEQCGLEFSEPDTTVEAFARQYASNGDGIEANPNFTVYDDFMVAGHAYVMDSYCLHRSVVGDGVRASIDFRVKYRQKLPSDVDTKAKYTKKYIPL